MLDPKLLRTDIESTAKKLARRGLTLDTAALVILEEKRKRVQVATQQLQAERNAQSKAIGMAKAKGEDTSKLMKEVANIGAALKQAETELEKIQKELTEIALGIPNIPHESVPDGKNENDNTEVRRWGEPRKFDFKVKDHADLGHALGMMDFDTAAKIAGARFVVMSGPARAPASCVDSVHARSTHANMATPRLMFRIWLMSTACAAPASCQSSRRIFLKFLGKRAD